METLTLELIRPEMGSWPERIKLQIKEEEKAPLVCLIKRSNFTAGILGEGSWNELCLYSLSFI